MTKPRLMGPSLLVSVVAAICVGASACSGGQDVAARPSPSTTTTTTTALASTTVAPTTTTPVPAIITVTPTVAMGETFSEQRGPVTSDPVVVDQLAGMAMRYVNTATIEPLAGRAAAIDDVLSIEAARVLTADRRAVLTDEGMPMIVAEPAASLALTVSTLANADKVTMVALVGLDLTVTGTTQGGSRVSVHRVGELTVINEAGSWKIDAFQFAVDRETP